MNDFGRRLFAFAAVAIAALSLLWFLRTDPTETERPIPAKLAAPRPQAFLPAPRPSPASTRPGRDWVAELADQVTRANARAREALLAFRDEASLARFRARAAAEGLTLVAELPGLRTVRVRYADFRQLQGELTQYSGDYEGVSANYLVSVPTAPPKEDRAAVNQVPFGNDTLAFLGVPGDHSQWGRGTTIAILDTGVAPDVTFGAGRLTTLDIGLGSAPGTGREDGHGTAVAALAGGLAPDAAGVAPAANLLSIRVTDAGGTSDIFTLAQGIIAAVESGARILNISLGGYATNSTLNAAIDYATAHGALLVAAAGNDQAAQLAWPAADPRVLSVGAVDRAEQQVSFSNSGPQLQLSAPGYGVQTAWGSGGRAEVDGTSASAPLVAGAVAAIMSLNPSLTPQQAADLLLRTASDAGAPGTDPAFGHGILNLGWAVNTQTPGYIDTAVSSHYYDPLTGEMNFEVQNRSSQAVSGMTLNVGVGTGGANYLVPTLAPGETYVLKLPVDTEALRASGSLTYTTQLTNPLGLIDRVPTNNRRASVLSAAAVHK